MKSFEIIDTFGDTVVVEPKLGLYAAEDFMGNKMPGLGIELYYTDEDGVEDLYTVLTVNLGEFLSVKNCAYIDTNNNSFTNQLLDMGFCTDTGLTKQSGFCTYPLWKFDEDFLKSIDPNGLYEVYSKKFDEYMNEGPDLPLSEREEAVVKEVVASLALEIDIEVVDSELVAHEYGKKPLYGAEVYCYLLGDVCEYNEDGSIKGLDMDLNVDFKDLCELNGVKYTEYSTPSVNETLANAEVRSNETKGEAMSLDELEKE